MGESLKKLEGKVAIITGGASGIGEATACHFINHAARAVVIADVQDEKGQQLAESIGLDRCVYMHCDVSNEDHIKTLIETTVKTYGQLDVMFCNAGILNKSEQTILDFDLSQYEKLFSVNVRGTAASVKHAARAMVEGKVKGSIICTASVAASMGYPQYTDYTMSKHAVLGLMRSASKQLGGYGIRVNSVSPGVVATPLACGMAGMEAEELERTFQSSYYLNGVLKVKHVADAVVFLASDDSGFITGHDLVVDVSPKMGESLKKLEGKVAIITGGASGIGEATAHHFINHAARAVVIADIQDEKGQELAESIGLDRCIYMHCDVSNEDHIKTLIETTVKTYGQLDVMFCNAGILNKSDQTILDFDLSQYEKLFSVNVRGTAASVKHAARAMVEEKVKGSIICTASLVASMGYLQHTDYTMSKHAVLGLMRSASKQLGGYGIRVNSVSPGGVATPLACRMAGMEAEELERAFQSTHYLNGVLKVKHVADAVVFLASDESDFITGHDLVVDGVKSWTHFE
ncbi:hypothetical protein Dsin_006071 [Dipteronia sinensis]|uniref:(21S)-21-acetoxyl-apo-melianone synthase SDR n=1 Tax=Dipteronia sinensis TaxID=43782 RepID=A0AAE0EFH9_9ROSI|nr:hypothetical protein Dsin_006071 [Dipteronia sinensis]